MALDVESARRTLRAIDRRLRELVAVAGTRTSDLGPVWKDCEGIGRDLADIAIAAQHASAVDRRKLLDEMTSLGEFYAIATEYLEREQSAVTNVLQHVRQARESLAAYGPQGESGDSCDVAG